MSLIGSKHAVSGGKVTNIAQGRPVFQSSTYKENDPANAVNGNIKLDTILQYI